MDTKVVHVATDLVQVPRVRLPTGRRRHVLRHTALGAQTQRFHLCLLCTMKGTVSGTTSRAMARIGTAQTDPRRPSGIRG